jgi:predicted HTH transcriptional regulator
MIISVVSYETDLVVVIFVQGLSYSPLDLSIGVRKVIGAEDRRANSEE